MSSDFVTICRSECEHFVEAYEPMIVALLGKDFQNLFFTVKVLDATVGLVTETEQIIESCCYENFSKRASYWEVL